MLRIEACPDITPVAGFRVVTGTFRHQAARMVEVHVEGLDEPIGTTPNHPFWSQDRQTFVRADELLPGEHLTAFNGTPIVRRITYPAEPEPVYNLEVQCSHVYHVAKSGVLVHNGTLCDDALRRIFGNDEAVVLGRDMMRRVEPAADYLRRATGNNAIRTFDPPMPSVINGVEPVWRNADRTLTELGKQSVEVNRLWIREQLNSGRRVFDIAGDAGLKASEWYRTELKTLTQSNMKRQFRGMIDVDGQMRPLWEWVPR